MLKQVRELALVKVLPEGNPLDPLFCCVELHLAHIIVESVNEVYYTD
jgi:hypothetical protein